MVSQVSGVSFTSAIGAMDKVSKEQLYNPGLYAMQEMMQEQPQPRPYKQHMTFLGFLGRIALTAAVVLGGPLLARKKLNAIKNVDLTAGLAKDAKFFESIKFRVAQFGDWVDRAIYQNLTKTFGKKTETPDANNAGNPTAPVTQNP